MRRWVVCNSKQHYIAELNDLTNRLLYVRGITNTEEAQRFFEPDYECGTHNPFLIFGMECVVGRLREAIRRGERIAIFGDYDADGICGAAVFSDFFRAIRFSRVEVYIPDRHKEGYGLSRAVVERFAQSGTRVLVSIDCGITNIEEVAFAQSLGIDVIIIDHHIVPPVWPPAYAIIDPKQDKDTYPFPSLCSAALAFKTVAAMLERESFGLVKGWERWLLDAVAIATIADMVPLVGENRTLVYWGLRVLAKTRRRGLRALYKKNGIRQTRIGADDIGFVIAPRINAASRMDHATTSFVLLTTDDAAEAERTAGRLEEKNSERKILVEEVLKEIRGRIVAEQQPQIIVAGNPGWQPGVLGIAANRLLDNHACPVFLWGKGESPHVKGSCRSKNTNVVELMRALPESLLLDFGGHAHSGGFSLEESCVPEFERQLRDRAAQQRFQRVQDDLPLDGEMTPDDVTDDAIREIARFEPFGIGNPRPVFLFRNVAAYNIRRFGSNGAHLAFSISRTDGTPISCIGFWLGNSHSTVLKENGTIQLAAALERSSFRGYDELRLRIVDIGTSDAHITYGDETKNHHVY